MKRSDITDQQVIDACASYHADLKTNGGNMGRGNSLDRLMAATGAPEKVALRAMERAYDRDLIECGMGIPWAWPNRG